MRFNRTAATMLAAAALATAGSLALAAPASAAPCGWQGDGTQDYNHCGDTNVMLTVEHVFGDDDHFCAKPGMNNINAGNSPYNTWRTTYAYYAGGPTNCFYGWYR
ncbi:DUF6355 family natural product biosynthesis protein [Glycomyces sp. NPDC049804]|jgi:hypothetical protein|uniref:DUF6355 family natural product biosynthesis protein n=1 Tax=Glycomyces sp. NPDC049804 TaxID=3154363 RepID=UPI0034287503